MVQNDKKFCPSHSISQEPYIIWSPFVVHNCKIISPGLFFIFPKFWFFKLLGGREVNRAKNDLKWQKILLLLISQEQYIIWSSFVVHKCPKWPKMTKNYLCRTPYLKKHTSYDCDFCCTMTSPDAFSIFSKFWLSVLFGGQKGKKWHKMTKFFVPLSLYLKNRTSYGCGFWYTSVK